MFKKLPYIVAILTLFSFSCSTKTDSLNLELKELKLFSEGPLFEGANTAQYELSKPLEEFLKNNNITKDKIHSITLKKAEIKAVNDTSNLDLFQSFTLQIVTEKTDMIKLAMKNPVEKGVKQSQLQVAEIQEELMKAFEQEKVTIVLDTNISSDSESNLELIGNLLFEIKVKK